MLTLNRVCVYVCVCSSLCTYVKIQQAARAQQWCLHSVCCSLRGVCMCVCVCVCVCCINVPPHVYSSAAQTSPQCSSNSPYFDLWITQRAESGEKLRTHTHTHTHTHTRTRPHTHKHTAGYRTWTHSIGTNILMYTLYRHCRCFKFTHTAQLMHCRYKHSDVTVQA